MTDRKPRARPSEIAAAAPIIKQLYESGMTTGKIAEEVGLSRETVRKSLVDSGVEVTTRGYDRRKAPPRKLLSDEEVERLRRLVGFDPDKPTVILGKVKWPRRKRTGTSSQSTSQNQASESRSEKQP